MARPTSSSAWCASAIVCTLLMATAQATRTRNNMPAAGSLSCDASEIEPGSYALTTRVMALIATEDRSAWWERFSVAKAAGDLRDLNWGTLYAAERAVELDPHNLLAHAVLARQDVVLGIDASRAEQEWRAVFDSGGAVVWTSTLYDVDVKSYFLFAVDRRTLRIYRFGELAAPFDTHLGMPKFPGPERERLWRAWGGCIDPGARPEATIPWTDISEIKAGNWVLYFKLARKVTIGSDNGKHADLNEIKVNLHGGTPSLDVRVTRDPDDPWKLDVRTVGIGPLAYQERIRRTLVKLVDPEHHISLPKASRSAGW